MISYRANHHTGVMNVSSCPFKTEYLKVDKVTKKNVTTVNDLVALTLIKKDAITIPSRNDGEDPEPELIEGRQFILTQDTNLVELSNGEYIVAFTNDDCYAVFSHMQTSEFRRSFPLSCGKDVPKQRSRETAYEFLNRYLNDSDGVNTLEIKRITLLSKNHLGFHFSFKGTMASDNLREKLLAGHRLKLVSRSYNLPGYDQLFTLDVLSVGDQA